MIRTIVARSAETPEGTRVAPIASYEMTLCRSREEVRSEP